MNQDQEVGRAGALYRRKGKGSKMTESNNDKWDVNTYGTIINNCDLKISGTNTHLQLKVTRYAYKNYIELWENGICIHFSEEMNS